MTLAEFKAWFEGFTEDMAGQPNAKQWKRIKARVAQIDGVAVTREVIWRDRYWTNGLSTPYYATTQLVGVGTCTSAVGTSGTSTKAQASNLTDLGKLEYQSMLAS